MNFVNQCNAEYCGERVEFNNSLSFLCSHHGMPFNLFQFHHLSYNTLCVAPLCNITVLYIYTKWYCVGVIINRDMLL